jgi:homoserine dehydrogenase
MPDLPPLRLGLAGLGTVGIGVVRIAQNHADLIAARAGRPVVITAVSARDRTKNRDADLSGYAWETDPVTLAKRDDVDLFIEVMGGHDGPAKDATEAAIAAGKDVVTANKAPWPLRPSPGAGPSGSRPPLRVASPSSRP